MVFVLLRYLSEAIFKFTILSSFDLIKRLAFLGVFLLSFEIKAQNPDSIKAIQLQSVVISSYKDKPLQETSLNIISLDIDSLKKSGTYNLAELMSKTPGMSMLTTGVSIAKPVIRGLYGNRVLILISGLKFDNQQWQDEHGLGLSDLGLSKVEIIKGPLSVLYGSEAIGGIINVIEEDKPPVGDQENDVSLKFNSNTSGGLIQGGYKESKEKHWFRIRAGIENNADYSDGNGDRVLNSRFDGYYLKSTYGFQRKNWTSTNNFMSSFNRFGFIFNDIYDFVVPDERWSRTLSKNPSHTVLLNILSSENEFVLKNNSKINFNIGIQSNKRLENEGGGAISLNMHLLTFQYLLKWETQLSENNKLIISNLGSVEDNTNFGARKIVPDANMQESNISVYLESTIHPKFILENGVGVGEKWIQTYFTASVNGPENEIKPFTKFAPYYNFFSGFTYFPNENFNVKFNVASGVRIPNLAELSSNGLHEGVFTYEIGDPDLKNEQNITGNLFLNCKSHMVDVSVSPFYNYFFNYVFLAPTSEEWFGFPVFRYKQQNVIQYGTEVNLMIKPSDRFKTGISYSGMISKTDQNDYTPYIPAQKIVPALYYSLSVKNKSMKVDLYTNVEYCFAQNNVAPNELSTPDYNLWNVGASTSFPSGRKVYEFSIAGNNLLNTAYFDHLSRFKNYGIKNIGRNITANLKVKF
ncbi:TonB-dependent receptor [soil metagenome]